MSRCVVSCFEVQDTRTDNMTMEEGSSGSHFNVYGECRLMF